MRKGFFQNNILTKRSLTGFSLFVITSIKVFAQSNLVFNGDFTEKTDLFYDKTCWSLMRKAVGWEGMQTPDLFTDTLAGNPEYVRIWIPPVPEMIYTSLTERLIPGETYKFSIQVLGEKNVKEIPLGALLALEDDTLYNEWYIYYLVPKRKAITPIYDEELNKGNDSKWKWYSVKFIADKPYMRIVIGDVLRQYNKKDKVFYLDHIHLYQLSGNKREDRTIQFK